MINVDAQELALRYIALWNEPDAELRRKAIQTLWTEGGTHMLQPPLEMRQAAARLGFGEATLLIEGYDALEVRVTRAYQEFVAPGQFIFRPRGNADRLGNIVKFSWEMLPAAGGDPAGGGLEFLMLDGDGRIKSDYQFIGD